MDVFSPLTRAVISTVPLSGAAALDAAVQAAKAAFPAWSATPIKERVQIFYRYKTLLERDMKALADLVREENGKTFDEARAEVEKAIELTEFACSMPQLIQGEFLEVSKGVEARAERKPLGVVASIAPFNFPNMVPHWTIPNAIVLGNYHDSEALGAGAPERREDCRAAEGSRPARRRAQRGERRQGNRGSHLRPPRHSGRVASWAPPPLPKSCTSAPPAT